MSSNVRCLLDLYPTSSLSLEIPTNLVNRHNQLLKKNVDVSSAENIRFMIGQGTALEILVPRAIELLSYDLLTEGDLFEGDLLLSVVSLDDFFWSQNRRWYNQVRELIIKYGTSIESVPPSKSVGKGICHFLGFRERYNLVND